MKIAYADPPYIGQSRKHYGDHPDYAGEVDHEALIARLVADYPDGWALSCSTPSLCYLLPLCPPDIRVGAWVKPFAVYKVGVNPGYTWEPVLWRGGRVKRDRSEPTVRDSLVASIKLDRGLTGAKPEPFSRWLFDLLGLQPGDQFDDLFPGSGGVARAWARWQAEPRMSTAAEYEPLTLDEAAS
jgi:hypothetical protein